MWDGDEERLDDLVYADSNFIRCNSIERPGIVDCKRIPITDPTLIYAGCYIRVSINFYPFNTNDTHGIGIGLGNVQYCADCEPLNGRVRAVDEFGAPDANDEYTFLN